MEQRQPRYHEVIPPEIKARIGRAVGRLLFGTADVSPNEVPPNPTPVLSQPEIDQLFANQYENQFETPGE